MSRTGAQRGAATLLVVAGVLVGTVIATAVLVLSGVTAAARRAQYAADLVAVSAAAAEARGDSPCAAARRLATANRTALRSCEPRGDFIDFVVTVTVAVPLDAGFPGAPREIVATAHAGWLSEGR